MLPAACTAKDRTTTGSWAWLRGAINMMASALTTVNTGADMIVFIFMIFPLRCLKMYAITETPSPYQIARGGISQPICDQVDIRLPLLRCCQRRVGGWVWSERSEDSVN